MQPLVEAAWNDPARGNTIFMMVRWMWIPKLGFRPVFHKMISMETCLLKNQL